MKRTPLKRTPMNTERKPLPRQSKHRAADELRRAEVRVRVRTRDGGRCQLAEAGAAMGVDVGACWGPPEVHEIVKASQITGGYVEENCALLCRGHNRALEADADLAAFARSVGLVKRREDR